MKAEIILGAYIGLQKAVIKIEEIVKKAVADVIVESDKKIAKVRIQIENNRKAFDDEMDKVSQKYIDKGIKTSEQIAAIEKRKSELQELL